jgi:LysM repeat protein
MKKPSLGGHCLLGFLSLIGFLCSASPLVAGQLENSLDELRLELADIKHGLHTQNVELNILDEKLKNQERSLSSFKTLSTTPKQDAVAESLSSLEKRLSLIEKKQEKISADLRQLSTQAMTKLQELEQEIAAENKRLDDLSKLKNTLSSLSKAIQQKPSQEPTGVYRVKPGDSLEKIARQEKISVDTLKKLNRLETDRITVGQELKLTHDHP